MSAIKNTTEFKKHVFNVYTAMDILAREGHFRPHIIQDLPKKVPHNRIRINCHKMDKQVVNGENLISCKIFESRPFFS